MLLGALLFIFFNGFYIEGDDSTALYNSIGSLRALLSLTEDVCGDVNWCSVQTRNENASKLLTGGCCKRCSCNNNCSMSGSCCPDFKLKARLNNTVFSNISTLLSVLQDNAVSFDDLRLDAPLRTIPIRDNVTVECVYSRFKEVHYWRPMSSMYFMVTKCSNITVDPFIKSKCESAYTKSSHISPQDIVPVQSLTTGIVYRNKYCHECSAEKHDNVVVWDMLIVKYGSPFGILYDQASSLEEVTAYAVRQITNDFLFEPNVNLRHTHPPEPCQVVDVETCRSGNRSYNLETQTACETFTLPVYAYVNGTARAYNNLACLSCNGIKFFPECSLFYKWEQTTEPFPHFSAALAIPEETRGFGSAKNVCCSSDNRLAKLFSPQCEQGFIYDNHLDMCRQVFCPCGMIVHSRSCIPFVGDIDALFEARITMSLTEHHHDIEKALLKYIYNAIESGYKYTVVHIDLFKAEDEDYAAIISFSWRGTTFHFSDVVSLTARWFLGVETIVNGERNVSVNMTITDSTEIMGDLLTDFNSRRTFKLVVRDSPNTDASLNRKPKMVISECNFCYRIEVMLREVQPLKSRRILIKRTNTILSSYRKIHKMLSNNSRKVLCVEKVINRQRLVSVISDRDSESTSSDKKFENRKHTTDNNRYTVAMPSALGFILLVICLSYYARKYAKKSEVSSGVNVELAPVPDK